MGTIFNVVLRGHARAHITFPSRYFSFFETYETCKLNSGTQISLSCEEWQVGERGKRERERVGECMSECMCVRVFIFLP